MELVWEHKQLCFSYAYGYAYVERVTSENSKRKISGFVLLMFLLMLCVAAVFTYGYALVKIEIKGTRN